MTIQIDPPSRIWMQTLTAKKSFLKRKWKKRSGPKRSSSRKLSMWRSFPDKFLLYTGERVHWMQVITRLTSTVRSAILPWVLLCGVYGIAISLLYGYGYLNMLQKIKALPEITVVINLALSLLLAFCTNTAYARFWEGRQLWGAMVSAVRNLSRGIWIIVAEKEAGDRTQKENAMRLVSSFAVSMKLHLRREPMGYENELRGLMSPLQHNHIQRVNHAPLEIAFWLGDYLQSQYKRKRLNVFQLQDLHNTLDEMVEILGGCERILKTPIPLIYTIILKLLLITDFIVVPLGMVETLKWWTGPAIMFVSFIFLTIHEIGSEIEEPFGHDSNDLPLDFICETVKSNVEDLIQAEPSSRHELEWPASVS